MGKRILVLTGSPRRKGNSDQLADAFIKGAERKAHRIVKFETAFKNIQGCRGCGLCWTGPQACVIRDDFDELSSLLEISEAIVFSSPLYWGGISAQLKTAWDRFHAYVKPEHKKRLAIKESVYMLCGHNNDIAQYEPAVRVYEDIARHMGWDNRGVILAPGALEENDIGKDILARAEALGESL
ncbi:MAG: flavodoxin family protein [Treponema sp.]|jgi:multimeric flavodoxin WrbA|nr:flavodoxin family protein [Treponema sp.]